ncbi:hypothetical protein G7Y79_00034g070040 [Physcia stellaris]|nr:hypothetical protein G7Y79_00034g070040 [Physcia stellaris]
MATRLPLILPPGGKRAKSLVDEYLECVEEGVYEGVSADEEENRRRWTTSQEKRRKYFKAIPKEDLADIARDGTRHAAWQKLHIKHELAQQRNIIRDIRLGQKSLEEVRRAKDHFSERLAELDPRIAVAPGSDMEKHVQLIKRMMSAMPRIAIEVLEDAQPALKRDFHLACDQLRDKIAAIEEHVTEGAIDECLARVLMPESWDQMVEHFRMTNAPKAALEESLELADIRLELAAVKQDLELQRDRADENAERLANEKFTREQTESSLSNAEALLQEQKSELRDLKKVEAELADVRQAFDSECEEKRELNRKLAASISDKRSAQEAAEEKLAVVEKALWDERSALESQRQSVDAFLEHFTASLAQGSASLIVAPRAQELTTLYTDRREQLASDQSEHLPTIVIASGHLPAAFSYLYLASGGVLAGSRFNRAVTSSDLPWLSDTMDRVVKAVVASREPVPGAMLIVLLQGIAYLHLATRSTSATMTPRPSDMLSSLYKLIPRTPQRTVLATVYRLVGRLVHHKSPITSWILDDSPLDRRINSSNSALPEGITLIHSAGYLFLQESATDGERLFIIEPEAVQIVTPQVGHTDMILPPVNGFNLRRLEIARKLEHASTSSWLRDNGLM